MNKSQTKNIGRKFNEDGTVRFFQGNTIISKVKEDNSVYPIICDIANAFKNSDGGENYGFLPEESLHMTMIQGVVDIDRTSALWTRYLPLDAPLSEVDDFFEKAFREVRPLESTRMIFDYIDISNATILVRFLPDTEEDAWHLKVFRDEVSDKLGLRFPDHDRYGFHISVAYQLWEHSEKQRVDVQAVRDRLERRLVHDRPTFVLRYPELTYFKNMYYFSSQRIPRNIEDLDLS